MYFLIRIISVYPRLEFGKLPYSYANLGAHILPDKKHLCIK